MTSYNKIYDDAADHYGLMTNARAHELGVSTRNLNDLARRGRLTRLGFGVYQLVHYVPTPLDPYAQAVALAGKDAFLCGESVLAILNLVPTNPARMYIGTMGRMRRNLDSGYRVRKFARCPRLNPIEGIAAQNLPEAIRDARRTVRSDRLLEATNEAYRRGMISENDRDILIKEIEHGLQDR